MTVSYTPAQTGRQAVGLWANGAMVLNPITLCGVQFTIPAPNELLFRSLTLSLTPTASAGAGTTTIAVCSNINEGVFSNTNLPSAQATIQVFSALTTYTVGVTTTFSLNLGVDQLQSGNFVGGTESANQVLGHSGFQGNVALVISDDTTVTTFDIVASVPTLVGDETPFLTGLPTDKNRLSRADWCPRCGQPIFREQLITDGYTKSLVCRDCWDPGEQRVARFVPPKEINP